MADGGCNDVVELEAMRKGCFTWHPCNVSLCPSGLGLIIRYEDSHSEEVIEDKGEILSRIRVRSTPLQGDDCTSLQQGNHVLATQSSDVNKDVFCDAQVEKVVRVRHSKRIHCRCSFTIKWIHQPFGREASNVRASAIMKLSGKSINLHPVVSTFFSFLESSNTVDVSLCSKLVDSVNWEMDINVLLEKQIEEINSFADKKISKNFLFELEVDHKGQCQPSTFDTPLKDLNVKIPLLNNLNGSTWSENKKQSMETSVETPPASISSIQEGLTGNRLPLNPLAARAALASLRSTGNFEKGVFTSDHCFPIADDPQLKVSTTFGNKSPNFEGIAKTLFPTSSAPPQAIESSDPSSRANVKGSEMKNKISKKKMTQPSETRVTRSRSQKNNGICESSQNDKGLLGKDEVIAKADFEKLIFSKDAEKHNYSKRKTRSTTEEETKENNVQPKLQLRKIDFSESNDLDLVSANDSTESKRVETTPKTAEGAVSRSHGKKRNPASSKNQETRSSPRLRLLPRTRSQTKV